MSSPSPDADDEMVNDDYQYDDEDDSKTDIDRVLTNKGANFGKPAVPHFDVTEYLLEVTTGESAVLECPVKNLGGKYRIFCKKYFSK